jgi:hypothetical protein
MEVCLLSVLRPLINLVIIVAMRQFSMVMFVGMPVRPVFELSQSTSNAADVMVGDVIVVVCVLRSRMGMGRLLAFAFSTLRCSHYETPFV